MLQLSKRRRWLAPLALIVGAFLMLFQGVKLLYTNWRLALVQIVPAMWIWIAMLDIKLHVLHGKQFHVIRGPLLIPCVLGVTVAHRGQLLPERRVRLRHLGAGKAGDPARLRPGQRAPARHFGLGLRHRPRTLLLRARSRPAGATGRSSSARASWSAS